MNLPEAPSFDARRIEIPVLIDGQAAIVVARENNDGMAFAYVYIAKAGEDDEHFVMSDGMHQETFGEGWLFKEQYIRKLTEEQKQLYLLDRNAAWAQALAFAHREAYLLTQKAKK